MKTAYFSIGVTHSGNRILNATLSYGCGCYGDFTKGERFENLNFLDLPEKIAYIQTVPHGSFILDPKPYAKLMQLSGYDIVPILIKRQYKFVIASHKIRYVNRLEDEIWHYILTAEAIARDFSAWLNKNLIIVQYESLVNDEEYRDNFLKSLGLQMVRDIEYFDGNKKYAD